MPDQRRHRGQHPADAELFAGPALPVLRTATLEMSWLLERGYADTAALKLVGDHHQLRHRQRLAVARAACPPPAAVARAQRRRPLDDLAGHLLAVDGFNCLITIEAALSGGLVLLGCDRAHRDLASVHGSYRRVEETSEAIAALSARLRQVGVAAVTWYLDRPVSNSGRLGSALAAHASDLGLDWRVELVDSPDRHLAAAGSVVATSDSWILDRCSTWVDLPGDLIARGLPAWLVDLCAGAAAAS